MSNVAVFRLAVAILAVSATSIAWVDMGPILGLDFQNIHAFHDCHAQNNPYLATGEACGDHLGRLMYYPPLLYWSFAWTRLLPFETAYVVWAIAIVALTAAALAWWVPAARRGGPMLLFGGLLMLQFPLALAVERGNNDVTVLVLWTIGAWLLLSGRPGLAGLTAALAVLLKIYPAFAVLVVLAGLLSSSRAGPVMSRPLVRYCLGGITAAVVAGLPLLDQLVTYARTRLPELALWEPEAAYGVHTLTLIAPGGSSWTLSLPLLVLWAWAAYKKMGTDPVLVLAGAFAISTYFASVSVDYNLITTYPLLLVLFARATATKTSKITIGLLVFGLVAIIGHRGLFLLAGYTGAFLQIWLQWAWLVALGAATAMSRITTDSDGRSSVRRSAVAATVGQDNRLITPRDG